MKERRTVQQLLDELSDLRQRILYLEKTHDDHKFTKAFLKNSVPMAISTMKEGRLIDISEAFLDLMGLEREEVIGNTSTGVGFITPEQRTILLHELKKKGNVENLELPVRIKGDNLRYGLFNMTKITLAGEDHLLTVFTDITRQKHAEASLREKEEFLRGISNNLPGAVYQFYVRKNGDMGLYYLNESAQDLLGLKEDLCDYFNRFILCVPPEQRESFLESIHEAVRTFSRWDHEMKFIKPSGEEMYIRGISRPRVMGDETVFDGVILDITDRRFAEEALKKSEGRFRDLVENTSDWIWEMDLDSRCVYASPRVKEILGYAAEEMLGKTPFDFMSPDDVQLVRKNIDHFKRIPSRFRVQERVFIHKDGSPRVHQVSGIPMYDESGRLKGYRGIASDVTDSKKAEKALRESENRFRRIAENSRDLIYRMSIPGGIYEYVSPASLEITGYLPEECYQNAKIIEKIIHPDWHGYFQMQWEQLIGGSVEPFFEYKIIHKSGGERWLYQRNVLVFDEAGVPIAIEGIVTDITGRKRVEEALRESEESLRLTLDATSDGIWDWDIQSGTGSFSPGYYTMLGFEPQEFPCDYMTWRTMVHPEDIDFLESKILDIFKKINDNFTCEFRMRDKSSDWRWVLSHGKVVKRNSQGEPVRMVGAHRDITERKQAEEQSSLSEKKFSAVFHVSPTPMVITEIKDGTLIDFNPACEIWSGYTRSELAGHDTVGLGLWKSEKDRERFMTDLKAKGSADSLEMKFIIKRGEIRDVLYSGRFIELNGRPYLLSHIHDITERRKAEESLSRSEEQLRRSHEDLEKLVERRTAELRRANKSLKHEVEVRKRTETALRSRGRELEGKRRDLEETNAALKVLLKQREEDKSNMEMNIASNIKISVIPHIEKLEAFCPEDSQKVSLAMIKNHLKEIGSPFLRKVSSEYLCLTPSEIQVAHLIKEGKSSKEIALFLNVSLNTIVTHRNNLRMKTGLKNTKVNLRSYLNTLE